MNNRNGKKPTQKQKHDVPNFKKPTVHRRGQGFVKPLGCAARISVNGTRVLAH
ncbi:hypothetical protein [Paraburkholderia rhizosphaerae]|uniref:hypothetical protein n=1 Tax=Paraburkholderia rhizosphaerae TaxID=480658 RepID=UPI001416FE55|nr:hypothetical protein [Paraburkholderia rhizosphaerae]